MGSAKKILRKNKYMILKIRSNQRKQKIKGCLSPHFYAITNNHMSEKINSTFNHKIKEKR